jgi:hypothetical protein
MEGRMGKLRLEMLPTGLRVKSMYSIPRVLSFCWALFIILFAVGCAPRPYRMSAHEEIFGTWTSTQRSPHKIVMLPNGTWEEYIYEKDVDPTYKGIYQIVEKWKDAEGNLWYKEIITLTFGTGKGEMTQELDKIDRSGDVWEFCFNYISKYDPHNFPKEINSKDYNYGIYKRSGR